MPLLKLNTSIPKANAADATPVAETPGGGRIKLKVGKSQPPTPAVDKPNGTPKSGAKKRGPNGDLASPAVKRIASSAGGDRRASITLKIPQARSATTDTPTTAGPRIKLQKRHSSGGPKLKRLNVKGRIPDRAPGNAYDSEDSERELDPAKEQQLMLRMQPGEDCDLLRKAIAERTLGAPAQEGGVEVTFKFLDRDLNRALITIRRNMYAAALVNLPCIVETMKSWDKRGWWKVADISQMLLVLGRVNSEDEAKHMPLPARVIDPKTMAYAHGLTPPMHWVRKRRFRKRLSYKDTLNVEEEVARLLEEDAKAEAGGGEISFEVHNRDSMERSVEPDDYFGRPADDNAVETIENDYDDAEGEEIDEEMMNLDDMEAMFAEDHEGPAQHNVTSTAFVDSPVALPDQAASIVRAETTSDTPAETPAPAGDDEDEVGGDAAETSDEDDDEDDIDDFDEDARARAAEVNLQQQEIEDLENEIRLQRQTLAATTNQILVKRLKQRIEQFESDLLVKKRAYGLDDGED